MARERTVTLRQRLHWIFRMALLLFILASVAFLSALTAMRYAVQGREVVLPDLVGRGSPDALRMLQVRGVGMKVEDRIYSKLPVDAVVRQSPPPNMSVKVGQDAYVVLSLGPQKEMIPELEEKSLRAARIELLRSGLQVGEISSAYLPDAPLDTVIQQDPKPGTTDVTSPHVDFLVSLGPSPATYVMPDVTGLPLGQVQSKLSTAGLKVFKITPAAIPGTPPGTVVEQSPQRGQRVDASINIELQVAE
jgi:eukaryotic-like serine/threonine-protein kinase